jgi:hypothetical protein
MQSSNTALISAAQESHSQMAILDLARRALAAATTAEEVTDIREKAIGLASHAKSASDKHLQQEAEEVRLMAEKLLDQMMEKQKQAGLLATGGDATKVAQGKQSPEQKPTLASQKITKDLAKAARKAAKMTDAELKAEAAKKVAPRRPKAAPSNTDQTDQPASVKPPEPISSEALAAVTDLYAPQAAEAVESTFMWVMRKEKSVPAVALAGALADAIIKEVTDRVTFLARKVHNAALAEKDAA